MLASLIELRRRMIQLLLIFSGFFGVFFFYSSELFHVVVNPLLRALPLGSTMIATQMTAAVFTPLKLALHAATLCSSPVALYHLWRFVAPGLYRYEKQRFLGLVLFSFILFCSGLVFCFYAVLPFMFQCFTKALPQDVAMMPDINASVEFITQMLFIFGFCFQLPLVNVLLVQLGWIDLDKLREFRPYAIVTAFFLGMILTPPDVVSQILLALPLCFLYELGLMVTKFMSFLQLKQARQ